MTALCLCEKESPIADWTVALDDLLCNLPQSCTLCGTKAGRGRCDIWTSARGWGVAFVVCTRCLSRLDALKARLAARYGDQADTV